jgi:hypothetical protein
VKAMARELQVPVICLSQLNRAAETREGHRPRMSDLRESGSIEQDADVIMLLHREDYYHKDDPEWVEDNPDKMGLAELILTKQRNGPTGTIKLSWISQSTRFRDYADGAPPAGYHEPRQIPSPPISRGNSPSANYADGASAPPFTPGTGSGGFGAGRKTGPVANYRDGGGPDLDEAFDHPSSHLPPPGSADDDDFDGIPV